MKELLQTIRPALISLLVFTVLCGVVYPAAMIGVAAVVPHPEPPELVGQPFDDPAYFWGRPSAISYNAMASGGLNAGAGGFIDDKGTIGPNKALVDVAQSRIQALRDADPGNTAKVPVDLVTASSSGLDPDISPAAAYYQASRIARLRQVPVEKIRAIIDRVTEERTLAVLGERRVNVVRLNKALDQEVARPKS
ncbi:MAG: potassium-transporting ATPase subunit C [Kofleriaceae bacterium]